MWCDENLKEEQMLSPSPVTARHNNRKVCIVIWCMAVARAQTHLLSNSIDNASVLTGVMQNPVFTEQPLKWSAEHV